MLLNHSPARNYQLSAIQGFSLLEIMITVIITSFGLLGIAGLQIASINSATVASVNTQTMISINEIIGQMRANPKAAKEGEFNISPDGNNDLIPFNTSLEPASGSSSSEISTYNWFQNLNNALPGTKAGIHCTSTGRCVVKIELPIKISPNATNNMSQLLSVQL